MMQTKDLFDIEKSASPNPSDLSIGTAAEHLVCYDLIMAGYRAFLTHQNCPYDVAVDIGGRLIRIQVKGTRCAKIFPQRKKQTIYGYMWHVKRAGKGGKRKYLDGDFDMLALVALDIKKIAYLPPSKFANTILIRNGDDASPRGGRPGRIFSQFPFQQALGSIR